METDLALRLVGVLNAHGAGRVSAEVAARMIVGSDVAHHVADEGALDLDPLHAVDLTSALQRLPRTTWLLALPRPGRPALLRGPAPFVVAGLDQGAAVVATDGGVGWVPYRVGPAVQWRLYPAERPFTPPTLYEAERILNELVLALGADLATLASPAGRRPGRREPEPLGPAYGRRNQLAADKAMRLLDAAQAGRMAEPDVLSSYAVQRRSAALADVENAALDLLMAAAGWLP